MKNYLLILSFFPSMILFGQGLRNDGAYIVVANNTNIYINGATGNYTANSNAYIKKTGTGNGGNILVNGDWVNNSSNVGFSNDGHFVELIGENQSIKGTHSSSFDNLSLKGTGTKTLEVETKVGGIDLKNGVLSLGTRPLKLDQHELTITNSSPAAITRSSGVIISEDADLIGVVSNPAGGNVPTAINPSIVTWEMDATTGVYTIPFGVSTAVSDYVPMTINKVSTTATNVSATTRSTAGNHNQPWTNGVTNMSSEELGLLDASIETVIDRWYTIMPSAPLSADLTLTYRGIENTTASSGGTFAMQLWDPFAGNPFDGSAYAWAEQQGSGLGVTSGTAAVSASGIQKFGVFVLSSLDVFGPLPVELINFSTLCDEKTVNIQWSTASENNSDYFILEKSTNGADWRSVDEINAAGNSSTINNYSIRENGNGLVYYRLRQVDINGKETIYGPISANCEGGLENSLSVFPNPNKGSFTVEVINNIEEDATIQIMDMQGRIIENRKVLLLKGVNQFTFDIYSIAKATYTLRVISESNFSAVKIVKD